MDEIEVNLLRVRSIGAEALALFLADIMEAALPSLREHGGYIGKAAEMALQNDCLALLRRR